MKSIVPWGLIFILFSMAIVLMLGLCKAAARGDKK